MEKLSRQVYTTEFRQQAVELITRDGLSIAEASRRLSILPKTLANWVGRAKDGDLPAGGGTPGTRSPTRKPSCHGCGERTLSCAWSATS